MSFQNWQPWSSSTISSIWHLFLWRLQVHRHFLLQGLPRLKIFLLLSINSIIGRLIITRKLGTSFTAVLVIKVFYHVINLKFVTYYLEMRMFGFQLVFFIIQVVKVVKFTQNYLNFKDLFIGHVAGVFFVKIKLSQSYGFTAIVRLNKNKQKY